MDKNENTFNIGDKVTVRAEKDIQGKRFIRGDVLEILDLDKVNAKLLSAHMGLYILGIAYIDKVD